MEKPRDASHDPARPGPEPSHRPEAAVADAVHRVQIVLWDGVELLDFAGPGQVLATAGFEVRTVAARPGAIVSQGFLRVEPDGVLGAGPAPDLLVVPGGSSERAVADSLLVEGVRTAASEARVILSVCTGALVLAAAGLLDGLEATTWHGALDRLRVAAPRTRVVEGVRWVDNGRIVTSAGVSAGIDAALHLVGRLRGDEARKATARYMEYPAS
jgi:transcriptional regulator GlxA family with amidase domain